MTHAGEVGMLEISKQEFDNINVQKNGEVENKISCSNDGHGAPVCMFYRRIFTMSVKFDFGE